jgi:zinc transport system ATP-binding protein
VSAPPVEPARDPVLELRNVSFAYRDEPVLEDVSLEVAAGDYLAILGPNGSGKTTLLRIVLGLVRPRSGEVRVLGSDPAGARGRVGYVAQRVHFDPDFPIRVLDVVRMGRLADRRPGARLTAEDEDAAREALARVELAELAQRPVGSLSGGQLQRVLIARALSLRPQLLLLDEPHAGLDERIGRSVWELLEELSPEVTIVLVSHDIGAISRYVRSVACLNRRLHAHPTRELTPEILEATYGCPVELLAHGHPHRVLGPHGGEDGP